MGMLYGAEVRPKILEAMRAKGKVVVTEIGAACAAEWAKADQATKDKFNAQAAKDREEMLKTRKAFEESDNFKKYKDEKKALETEFLEKKKKASAPKKKKKKKKATKKKGKKKAGAKAKKDDSDDDDDDDDEDEKPKAKAKAKPKAPVKKEIKKEKKDKKEKKKKKKDKKEKKKKK